MAGKNQVMLTFAGDSTQLDKTMKGVGGSSEKMGKKVGDSADRFNRAGEAADTLDTRAMGMRDTFTGVQDTFQAFNKEGATMQERALLLGMGIGDLGSGIYNFGIQFARQVVTFAQNAATMVASMATTVASTVAGWVTMGVQATINAAKMALAWVISLGPIGLVILAIGAVIGILVALGVGFDDLKRWAGAAWKFVKDGATAAKDWIGARVSDIVGFFTGLPGRIGSAVSGMWDGIKGAFRSAINWVIDAWNGLSFTLPKISAFGKSIGGQTLSTPNIPRLHQGGLMPGAPGTEGLALLQAGERVTRAGAAQVPTINVYVAGSIHSEKDLVAVIRNEFARGGFRGAF